MLRICKNDHITGFRHCGTCGTDQSRQLEMPPRHPAINRKAKRAITQAIRDEGDVPVADMRKRQNLGGVRKVFDVDEVFVRGLRY